MSLRPGSIYWAAGSGPKRRPFVVVSRSELNRGKYFLAVPFTSSDLDRREDLPNCVAFAKGDFGLPKRCVAQADALTQLRKTALGPSPEQLGMLNDDALAEIIDAIGNAINADCKPLTDQF